MTTIDTEAIRDVLDAVERDYDAREREDDWSEIEAIRAKRPYLDDIRNVITVLEIVAETENRWKREEAIENAIREMFRSRRNGVYFNDDKVRVN